MHPEVLKKLIPALECLQKDEAYYSSNKKKCSSCHYVQLDPDGPTYCSAKEEGIKLALIALKDYYKMQTSINEDIAALQCALDKANEKLAYISGDETYYYNCESGRRQLNAWWKAHLAMEKEEN